MRHLVAGLMLGCAGILLGGEIELRSVATVADSIGLAAPFAGKLGDDLILGGGANFPDKMPWEGGQKAWHDTLWRVSLTTKQTTAIGKLPRPLAYGISVTVGHEIWCFGGSDATQHFAEGFKIIADAANFEIKPGLPPLPRPCANAAWCVVGEKLFVLGGTESPTATSCLANFWSLDLKIPKAWQTLSPFPGQARMLAVCGTDGASLFVFSGASLSAAPDGKPQRTYLKDAWSYSATEGWKSLPEMPRAAVAAPSPAPFLNEKLHLISGDDGTKVDFQPKSQHPGFPTTILHFHPKTNTWTQSPGPISRATLPIVASNGTYLLPNGETRPGVRTAEIWEVSENK